MKNLLHFFTAGTKAVFLTIFSVFTATILYTSPAAQASAFSFILLSRYEQTLNIGDESYLSGVSTDGYEIKWKSSNSRIASVNTYGVITAKKAGQCKITAKCKNAETNCHITVRKTTITLSARTLSMENGASYTLTGRTSNGSALSWRSSKKSVALIDENGRVEAVKPGETTITASADGAKAVCRVTVKKPKVTLSHSDVSLYRRQTFRLQAKVSSGRTPVWQSKKNSVATVDENGRVTAIKHGTARICASIDGIKRYCEVTVKPPKINLSTYAATMHTGDLLQLNASVSSGITPSFKSSKSSVASVEPNGCITAEKKGTCYIYVSEDGTKVRCKITVK